MAGRIDVHAHLLPDLDDGCQSFDESIECARMMVAAGYTHAFCTPHIVPLFPENTVAHIRDRTRQLQERFDRDEIPLHLEPGGEINLTGMWPALSRMSPEEIPTYGLAGTYVLIDFWADALPECFGPAILYLKSLDLTPILAHPERAKAFQNDPPLIERVREMGVLLQGNLQCFTDPAGSPTRTLAESYLLGDHYFLLGTDCHVPATLPIRLSGLEAAEKIGGRRRVNRLTIEHPRRLLGSCANESSGASA